jgi:hypothetical protein
MRLEALSWATQHNSARGAARNSEDVVAELRPTIGDWYKMHGGDSFEVVAFDEDDGTIELQYFDGTIEEMDLEDWEAECDAGRLESVEPPEDWTGSVDVDPEDEEPRSADSYYQDDDRRQSASRLDNLDLFE